MGNQGFLYLMSKDGMEGDGNRSCQHFPFPSMTCSSSVLTSTLDLQLPYVYTSRSMLD